MNNRKNTRLTQRLPRPSQLLLNSMEVRRSAPSSTHVRRVDPMPQRLMYLRLLARICPRWQNLQITLFADNSWTTRLKAWVRSTVQCKARFLSSHSALSMAITMLGNTIWLTRRRESLIKKSATTRPFRARSISKSIVIWCHPVSS